MVFALLGLAGTQFFFTSQTKTAEVIAYGTEYMYTVTLCSFGLFLSVTTEYLLQSTGRTMYTMITQMAGAALNIILDPILIFGLFGFPKMEVLGAAVATVASQIIAMLLGLYFNCKKNKEINLNMRGFRPHRETIQIIYQVGLPSIVMQSIVSIMVLGVNKICIAFSETAVSVFTVYYKLQSFVFMPIFGLNNGIIPIIAYNFGAKNKKRIYDTMKISMLIAEGIMLSGLIVFQLFPKNLLGMFNASEEMLQIGIPALRIISLCFILTGLNFVMNSVFQGLGNGIYSLFTSVTRQLIIILPVAYICSKIWGLTMVWWSVPLAEAISFVLGLCLLKRIYREKLDFSD